MRISEKLKFSKPFEDKVFSGVMASSSSSRQRFFQTAYLYQVVTGVCKAYLKNLANDCQIMVKDKENIILITIRSSNTTLLAYLKTIQTDLYRNLEKELSEKKLLNNKEVQLAFTSI